MTPVDRCDKVFKIPYMIWIIGVSALLMNLSSIIVFSLTPLYLTHVFGMNIFHLGILEGVVEFFSWGMRVFSGLISDYFRKRKPLLILAYVLTTLSRPIFALAPSVGWIYFAKLTDRISNGLQATPREALVGDIAPKEKLGACYGLRQSLGFAGSILGALSIMLLMPYLHNNFSYVFWVAGIPALLALLAMAFFVKDVVSPDSLSSQKEHTSFSKLFKGIVNLNASFWLLMLIAGVFMVSNYSGAYRILYANSIGMPLESVSVVMLVQNIGALAGFPIGKLSDKYNRRGLLAVGFIVTILANSCFAVLNSVVGIIIGAALWGVQMGITQSLFQAMVSDTVPQDLRGSGFGIYYLVIAFALFIANAVMGFVFDSYGALTGFMISSGIAFTGLLLIGILAPYSRGVKGVRGTV